MRHAGPWTCAATKEICLVSGHADRSIDIARAYILATLDARKESFEDALGLLHGIGLAPDRDMIAARRDFDTEAPL
jgi:hypothetical protein